MRGCASSKCGYNFFSTSSITTKSQKWHYKMTPRAPNFVYNNQFWATTKCILMFLTWCGTMSSGSCATEGEKQIDNIHCQGLRRGIADCESTKDCAKKNQWHDEMISGPMVYVALDVGKRCCICLGLRGCKDYCGKICVFLAPTCPGQHGRTLKCRSPILDISQATWRGTWRKFIL